MVTWRDLGRSLEPAAVIVIWTVVAIIATQDRLGINRVATSVGAAQDREHNHLHVQCSTVSRSSPAKYGVSY
jgi:hypothetical protein